MTERERICLAYLDYLMEANARMIGEQIVLQMKGRGGSNLSAVGANVVGALRRRGLVTYLPDLAAWRITPAGRAALAATERKNV